MKPQTTRGKTRINGLEGSSGCRLDPLSTPKTLAAYHSKTHDFIPYDVLSDCVNVQSAVPSCLLFQRNTVESGSCAGNVRLAARMQTQIVTAVCGKSPVPSPDVPVWSESHPSDAVGTFPRDGMVLPLVVQIGQLGAGIEIGYPRGQFNTVVECQIGAEDRVDDEVNKATS